MAFTLDPETGKYTDLPYANFPAEESTENRMNDISAEILPLVSQYEEYVKAGNYDAANQIINDNPAILDNYFGPAKFNWIRDTLIAMERYYLGQIIEAYERTIQNAIGINDNPTKELAPVVGYSAEHIEELVTRLRTLIEELGDKVATFVVDHLKSTRTDQPLSANQGRVLDEKIDAGVEAIDTAIQGIQDNVSTLQSQIGTANASINALQTGLNRHSQDAGTITAGTFAGRVIANSSAISAVSTKQVRNIYAGTAAVSSLTTGDIYIQYS